MIGESTTLFAPKLGDKSVKPSKHTSFFGLNQLVLTAIWPICSQNIEINMCTFSTSFERDFLPNQTTQHEGDHCIFESFQSVGIQKLSRFSCLASLASTGSLLLCFFSLGVTSQPSTVTRIVIFFGASF